jgi:hypothetical protein
MCERFDRVLELGQDHNALVGAAHLAGLADDRPQTVIETDRRFLFLDVPAANMERAGTCLPVQAEGRVGADRRPIGTVQRLQRVVRTAFAQMAAAGLRCGVPSPIAAAGEIES